MYIYIYNKHIYIYIYVYNTYIYIYIYVYMQGGQPRDLDLGSFLAVKVLVEKLAVCPPGARTIFGVPGAGFPHVSVALLAAPRNGVPDAGAWRSDWVVCLFLSRLLCKVLVKCLTYCCVRVSVCIDSMFCYSNK